MEAVQQGIDALASLEERIHRAIQVITTLRSENQELQRQLSSQHEAAVSAQSQLDEIQASFAARQRENAELDATRKRQSEELDLLRGERKQVKNRIEKLLSQLDLLSAS